MLRECNFVVVTAVNATGRSLQGPTISSLISKFSSKDEHGAVFGLFHGLSSLARAIGPYIAGKLFDRHISGPYALAAAITLCVGIWTLLLRMQTPVAQGQAAEPDVAQAI